MVNSYIAWRNHHLKGKPENQRKWVKYGMREARLELITRWAKRAMRHYPKTQPHKNKRRRIVTQVYLMNLPFKWAWRVRTCATGIAVSRETSKIAWRPRSLCYLRWKNRFSLLGVFSGSWWNLANMSFKKGLPWSASSDPEPTIADPTRYTIFKNSNTMKKEIILSNCCIEPWIYTFNFTKNLLHLSLKSEYVIDNEINEKIYNFNPPCPPCPARHKARNHKSII